MKFGLFSLVAHHGSGSQHERLRRVVDDAVLAEELGFDAYGVGERHGEPFLSSAPPVILAAVAERTRRVRLLTTLTVISVLDPVRVAEDYATLDQLSGGRLELMIGKGNDPRHFPLFGLEEARQWEYQEEKFELLRRLWYEEQVTWSGRFRPPLTGVTTQPRPFAGRPRIWHGSASSTESTELAAKWGDPLFTANGFHPKKKYADLIDHYRRRWAEYGHDPADALVGSGAGGLYVAKTSQAAVEGFRPHFEELAKTPAYQHNRSEFTTLEEKIAGGSALVGSPQQVIDKIADYHASFGHQVQAVSVDGLDTGEAREVLELFAAEVMPVVRRELPSTVWESELSTEDVPS
ncbi:alkanesulfonate monooxygenase SsuD/methylene tetrahydromethanopterin reductase-like flavin-dependent oxidoreductase (luciferase family) [Amycolatopsis bartoniae]|uniref:Luciferase-like monooxygenase n=1 Tax=Amycolatopsis bartoniae TaxID=941986 RepID=A0A8H9IP05_9PSEU|nr:LLM class flavin-dependent oxidoreductase [Amycolatopsis bartoniae]MBB2937691.1 alkanesulfonate monooxygenase SsuD/methylene tetrahydromethanopterin reductase-like flavin-dependent oxidoreductase (luciferase family) [Amycolatopsis bartoniae]TVT08219.1 LLM class flavin-dependent oxidoreductase [Amycolatopsis bartoniae]GHF39960.1 luciferase-like monooxygenase [Amycolatopsis bartoniae]